MASACGDRSYRDGKSCPVGSKGACKCHFCVHRDATPMYIIRSFGQKEKLRGAVEEKTLTTPMMGEQRFHAPYGVGNRPYGGGGSDLNM